mmetsp:Transcript_24772/g.59820  ORF Transcript_24772/g.59820 Transcript_24772/m.59820 type:complete len:80 (-) Transcript_24772:1303-1542(-)
MPASSRLRYVQHYVNQSYNDRSILSDKSGTCSMVRVRHDFLREANIVVDQDALDAILVAPHHSAFDSPLRYHNRKLLCS